MISVNLDIKVVVSENCVHIEDSYTVGSKKVMRDVIKDLKKTFSTEVIRKRSTCSMVSEWMGHNNLYKLNIARSHTKDVDLEYPQKWYLSLVWFLLGLIKI